MCRPRCKAQRRRPRHQVTQMLENGGPERFDNGQQQQVAPVNEQIPHQQAGQAKTGKHIQPTITIQDRRQFSRIGNQPKLDREVKNSDDDTGKRDKEQHRPSSPTQSGCDQGSSVQWCRGPERFQYFIQQITIADRIAGTTADEAVEAASRVDRGARRLSKIPMPHKDYLGPAAQVRYRNQGDSTRIRA